MRVYVYTIQTHFIIITSLMYKQTDQDIRYIIAIVRFHGIISKPRPFYHYNYIIQILCFNVLHFNIIIIWHNIIRVMKTTSATDHY